MCKTTKKSKDSDMSTHETNTCNKKFTPTKYFATGSKIKNGKN